MHYTILHCLWPVRGALASSKTCPVYTHVIPLVQHSTYAYCNINIDTMHMHMHQSYI